MSTMKLASYKVCIVVIFLIFIGILVQVRNLKKIYSQPANPSLILVNAEAARNLAAGRGLVVDEKYEVHVYEKGIEEEKIVDAVDAPLGMGHRATYEPFSYADEVGYPLFLGALWKFTPPRLIYASIFQIILNVFASVAVFTLARKMFSSDFVGIIALSLYSLGGPQIVLPIQHSWIGLLIIFICYLLWEISVTSGRKQQLLIAVGIGLLCGVGTLMRSTFFFIPFVVIICFLIQHSWKRAFYLSMTVLLLWGAILAPQIIRNKIVFSEAQSVRKVFWHTVTVGLAQFPNPWQLRATDGSVIDYTGKKTGFSNLWQSYAADPKRKKIHHTAIPIYEGYLQSLTMQTIRSHPLWYMGTIIERIPMAIFPFHWAILQGEIMTAEVNGQEVYYSQPHPQSVLIKYLIMSLGSIAGLGGMYLARSKWRILAPLWLVWLYFIFSYSVIYVTLGYMSPIAFVYCIFSAYTSKVFVTSKRVSHLIPQSLKQIIND